MSGLVSGPDPQAEIRISVGVPIAQSSQCADEEENERKRREEFQVEGRWTINLQPETGGLIYAPLSP